MQKNNKFFCLLLFEGTFTSVFTEKKAKKAKNSAYQGFSYSFSLVMEGSGVFLTFFAC
jgi:hypothetical protein